MQMTMYLNGRFVPQDEGLREMQQMGQSIGGYYDTERTFGGEPFRLRLHLERLYNGINYSDIDVGVTIDEMESLTLRVLESNRPLPAGSELTITQLVALTEPNQPDDPPRVTVAIYCQPLDVGAFGSSYIRGVRVATPVTYGAPNAGGSDAKAGSPRQLLLMTGPNGRITECQGANFMFVRDGRVKLPNRRNVLPGVSMRTALDLCESLGIEVDEAEYSIGDVYEASEAFVSSTRFCLLPVATINGYRLGNETPGPVTIRLLAAWRNLVGINFIRQAIEQMPRDAGPDGV